ncbi:MAG: hypothetical protein WKF96_13710 [Solirubrobacteraceae bacterium]
MSRGRGMALAATLVAVAVTILAATAFACTPAAVIDADDPVEPGGVVNGLGSGFGPANVPGVTPVELHLQTPAGAELGTVWAGSSGPDGRFSFSFEAPEQAGYYVLAATRPGQRGAVSNNLQVGNPEAVDPAPASAPGPAPEQPAAGRLPAVERPIAPVGRGQARDKATAPSPNGSPPPAGENVPARRQVQSAAPLGADSARGGAVPTDAPALKRLGALDADGRPDAASSTTRRGRSPSGAREASIAVPEASQPIATAQAGGAGSNGSVWLGLGLAGTGLLLALTAGAALLGGTESSRLSLARLRHLRRRG